MANVKLLIVDDHPLIIDGIRTMLKDAEDISFAGACKSGQEALEFIEKETPDIILLDISLPDMDGLRVCEAIRKVNRQLKIIGLTSANESGLIAGLLQRGANGYLLKNLEREELINAIHAVVSGKIYLSKDANEKLLDQFRDVRSAVDHIPVLTRREKEILQLLSDGLNGPQIAEKLFLSTYTIETHRKNLLKKFNANSVQMLLRTAREYKMLS